MLIDSQEILDLIAEVGCDLQLCVRSRIQEANSEYGSPQEEGATCRPVRGYVVPERFSEIQVEGSQEVRGGGYIAYITPEDLKKEDLNEGATIAYDAQNYDVEYLLGIQHRGQVILHKLRLPRSKSSVKQPDMVLEFPPGF